MPIAIDSAKSADPDGPDSRKRATVIPLTHVIKPFIIRSVTVIASLLVNKLTTDTVQRLNLVISDGVRRSQKILCVFTVNLPHCKQQAGICPCSRHPCRGPPFLRT